MKCQRCGAECVRYTANQTRCNPCQAEVDRLIAQDAARRSRFAFAKVVAA